MTDSQGREVCDVEVEGRGVDAFIARANYLTYTEPDGSYVVPESELDYLTENYREYIDEESFQNAICAAEYACERDR